MTTIPRLQDWPSRAVAHAQSMLTPGPRMADEVECVASVLLAIAFGHLLGARNISWAAFSGYMVMRGHVLDSLQRGVLRIIGTAFGAVLAVGFVMALGGRPVASALALALVGGATLYAALTTRRSYAWLFTGLTFCMIVLDQIQHPAEPVRPFATTRMEEVAAGTFACVLVSTASALSLRRLWPAARAPGAASIGWQPEAARHAGQAAAAMALVPLVHLAWARADLAQAAVAIMAVMLVPVEGIGSSALRPVSRRIGLRIVGCALGAAYAAAVLLVFHTFAAGLIAGTMLGVALGRHIENGQSPLTYGGTQFTLAVLVTLVPDDYGRPDAAAGWIRLAGTLIGIALLEPVLIAWHLAAPRRAPSPARTGKELGDI